MSPLLHRKVFADAVGALERGLEACQKSETTFWKNFRDLRAALFQIEFLAKFYRKAQDRKVYERLIELSKPLEDQLGILDDLDAMIPFCTDRQLMLPRAHRAAEAFRIRRQAVFAATRAWMKRQGFGDGAQVARIRYELSSLSWLEDAENRDYARTHLKKTLTQLQHGIARGDFAPQRKSGYRLGEVEPRVHKLRREVRKQAQFLSYTGGVFRLTPDKVPGLRGTEPLRRSIIADSPYSRLPKAAAKAVPFPRDGLLLINRYTFDLGAAKDWALRLVRLRQAGLDGGIDFDQLDVTLTDWRGVPVPFNTLVLGILRDMEQSRVFTRLAQILKTEN